jgi:Lon protease-like protein
MRMELTELPLFPLHAVLFPGIGQSLNIFEDRYKVMLADCLQGSRRLGIVGIETGVEVGGPAVPYAVGCLAQIIEVENSENDQTFVIQVAGLERIRVLEIDEESKPYLRGRVELWPDEAIPGPTASAAAQAGGLFNEYIAALLRESGRASQETLAALPLKLPDDPELLSFIIGALVQAPLDAKQQLLEAPSAGARLDAEIRLLNRELSLLRRTHAGPELDPREGRSHFSLN